jgi:hypothetical protein
VVVATTAQRLHSNVRDFGSGKNFDFGIDDVDMGRSQTGQTGTIIVEFSAIRCSAALTPAAEKSDTAAGLNRQREC